MPQSGYGLLRRARRTANVVRELEREGRWPLAAGAREWEVFAEGLEDGARELDEAMGRFDMADQGTNAARGRADRAVEGADAVVPWVERMVDSLLRLAGHHGMADRIRRSVRR